MIDFFFLIPIAIGHGLIGLASFMWTLKNGQYDDLQGAAERILFEGEAGPLPAKAISSGQATHPEGERNSSEGRSINLN
jgi:cbb3-type cytochrome oxidase maturation protein